MERRYDDGKKSKEELSRHEQHEIYLAAARSRRPVRAPRAVRPTASDAASATSAAGCTNQNKSRRSTLPLTKSLGSQSNHTAWRARRDITLSDASATPLSLASSPSENVNLSSRGALPTTAPAPDTATNVNASAP